MPRAFTPLFAAFLAARVVPASAQPAQELNRIGFELFRKGDFKGAAGILEQVVRIAPSPKIHRNLGLCYLKLHEDEKVVAQFQAYLTARPQAPDRKWVEEQIAAAEERIASKGSAAEIESQPSDAVVYLDDAPKPLGRTPLSTRLPLGKHVLRFEKEGFETQRLEIEAKKRERLPVMVALARARPAERSGYVTIRSNVDGADVFIDSVPRGKTPLPPRLALAPGGHKIEVRKPGYRSESFSFTASIGAEVEAPLRLTPLPLERRRSYRYGAYAAWATSGAAVAAGLAVGAMGFFKYQDYKRQSPRDDSLFQQSQSLARTGDIVIFGAGGAALLTGLLFYFLAPQDPIAIEATPVPGGMTGSIGGRF